MERSQKGHHNLHTFGVQVASQKALLPGAEDEPGAEDDDGEEAGASVSKQLYKVK